MPEWAGVINTTAPKYLKGAADNTIRERLLLSLLKKYGRIQFGQSSYQCTWDVEFAQQPVESYGDMGVLNFSRHDLYRQCTIDWRGYKATDLMSEKERLMNDGAVAIINRYNRIMPTLMKAMKDTFCAELFIDGNAAGNENRLHGLESFMGVGTTGSADRIAEPSDTYAGRSTALGNQGGTWSSDLSTSPNSTVATDWPNGSGDSEYDYFSPKLINYTASTWADAATWEDTCERVLRQATIWLTVTGGMEGRPTCHLLASDLFYTYLNKQETKQRIVVPHKEAQDLGFGDTLNQEGVMIKYEFDVPAGTGYGINVHQMELASLDGQLFGSRGPEYDIKQDAYLFAVGFFGNCRYNPKHFAKYASYAS